MNILFILCPKLLWAEKIRLLRQQTYNCANPALRFPCAHTTLRDTLFLKTIHNTHIFANNINCRCARFDTGIVVPC